MGPLLRRPLGDKPSEPSDSWIARGGHSIERHKGLLEFRNVHEDIDAALGACRGRHQDACVSIVRVQTHAEVDPPTTFQGGRNVGNVKEIPNEYLGSRPSERFRALVVPPHKGAY